MQDGSLADKDALLADMATHQRMTGREVTAEANDRLAVPLFERVAAQVAAQITRPVKRVAAAPDFTTAQAHADARGKAAGRSPWKIEHKPPSLTRDIAKSGPHVLAMFERLQERIALLMTKRESGILGAPSWRDRVLAVLAEKLSGRDVQMRSAHLIQLCEDSNASFGDWKKEPGQKLWSI